MTTQQLIEEALSLPVDERIMVADSLLRSLNTLTPENEQIWLQEARRRDAELESGKAKAIPGDEVFAKAWARRTK